MLQENPIEKKVLPDKISYYTESRLPHTQSQSIGSTFSSSHSRTMLELEKLTNHGKKRTDIRDNYKYSLKNHVTHCQYCCH